MAAIADIRNRFAHSPRNIGGSLEQYGKGLSPHEKQLLLMKPFATSDEVAKNAFDPAKG